MKKHKPVVEMGGKESVHSFLNIGANTVAIATGIVAAAVFCAYTVVQFNRIDMQFEKINNTLADMNGKFVDIDRRFTGIEIKLEHTNSLLNADLTWRYLYSKDPFLKKRVPVYDPIKQTIEFVVVDSATHK